MIRSLGFDVDAVYNGRQAIDIILKNMSTDNESLLNKNFDFILMDCDMPVMNGFEATKVIKRYIKKGIIKPIKISACTAFSQERDLKACYDSGMDDVVLKPVSRD